MILDFGYVCMEIGVKISRPIQIGKHIKAEETTLQIGGSGAIQTIAAARAGARISIIGTIGNDLFAENIKTVFRREGIITSSILKTNTSTPISQKITDLSGKTTTIENKAGTLTMPTNQSATNMFNERNLILLHDNMNTEQNLEILGRAKNAGCKIIMSFQTENHINKDLLNNLDVAIISEGLAIPKSDNCHITPAAQNGFDCFCGTFAACIQAGLKLTRAHEYAAHAQTLYQENENSGYAARPYLTDIEKRVKKHKRTG